MDSIGIKLADGSFYPILESGKAVKRQLSLTTVKDNQTTVHVDLYRSHTGSMEDAEYVDTLEIANLNPHGNGEPNLNLDIELDEDNNLSARMHDPETGMQSDKKLPLISRSVEERSAPANFSIGEEQAAEQAAEPEPNPFDEIFAEPEESVQPEETPQPSFEEIVNSISAGTEPEPASFEISEEEVKKLDEDSSTQTEDSSVIGPSPNSEDFIFDGEPESSPADEAVDIAPPDVLPEAPVEKKQDEELVLPDFDDKEFETAETAAGEQADSSGIVTTDNFELPDFDEAAAKSAEEPAAPAAEAEAPAEEPEASTEDAGIAADAEELPDFDSIVDEIAAPAAAEAAPAEDRSIADDLPELPDIDDLAAETPAAEETVAESLEPAAPAEDSSAADDTLVLPDIDDLAAETPAAEETVVEELEPAAPVAEEAAPAEDSSAADDALVLPDIDDLAAETPAVEETAVEELEPAASVEEAAPAEDSSAAGDALVLPDFDSLTEETASAAEESEPAELAVTDAEKAALVELTDDEEADSGTDELKLPDFDDIATDTTVPAEESSAYTASVFELPDFDDTPAPAEEKSAPAAEESNAFTASVFELPDFDDGSATPDSKDNDDDFDIELPDFSAPLAAAAADTSRSSAVEEFRVPDFDSDFDAAPADADTDFDSLFGVSSTAQDAAASMESNADFAPQHMFDDLYDQETLAGKSSRGYDEESDEVNKRTRLPVIICVACAVICLLSLLGVLFWKVRRQPQPIAAAGAEPSATSTEKSTGAADAAEEKKAGDESPAPAPAQTTAPAAESTAARPAEKQAEPAKAESAKENEIVIAAVPSTMVPEQPAKPKQKIPDIRYKVNWGDTLWDISNAYYKNPWRYKELAAYNGIKNPNYIKAGSYILIPAE